MHCMSHIRDILVNIKNIINHNPILLFFINHDIIIIFFININIFFYYSVPETRGKSLEEIEEALGVNKYDN